ncbi:MAG: restriction endonuclease subunit S [Marinomonas sp.]|nr:MAG: restriction endonuclease subunit S [Marinomonas sp.]
MNWVETTVGEYCPFVYGKGLPKAKRVNGTVPVYGSNGVVDSHIEAHVYQHGVIIGRKGTCGAVTLSESDFWPIDTTFYVTKDSLDETRFVYYLLSSLGMEHMNSDSAVPGLNRDNAHSLRIVIPERKEDRERLGAYLALFDEKIELNIRMNQTLEKVAQRIFMSWFVDFDPVKANVEGVSFNRLSPEIHSLFPSEFEESELGLIPKGWKVSTIGKEFDVTMGQSPPGSSYNESNEGILFFQGRRDFGFRYPSERVFTNQPKRLASAGDTLLSVRAPVGDINKALKDCCIGRGVGALRHKSGCESFTYYSAMRLKLIFDSYDGEGTVFGSINQIELKSIKVIAPCKKVLKSFSNIVGPLDEKIKVNTLQIDILSKIRDKLLPRLISGQITIEKANELMEEVC